MMGLKDEIFHLSWFITYALQAGFLALFLISELLFASSLGYDQTTSSSSLAFSVVLQC